MAKVKRLTPKRPRVVAPAGPFASVGEAIDDIRRGKMVIVVDDEDRENEGDLTIAAEKITPAVINFMAKHGRGLICMPMTQDRLAELDLPQIKEDTATFLGNALERDLQLLAAVTADRVEGIARKALVVHAHQHRPAARDIAHRERDVLGLGVADRGAVSMHGELAVFGRQLRRRDALDEALLRHAMSDQVLHGDEPETVTLGKSLELGHPRHGPIGVCDLADDTDRG